MLVVRGVPLLQVGSSFFMPLDFLVTYSTNEKVSAAEECKALLLKLAMLSEGVICCRVLPLLKALVKLVKDGLGTMTLAIGDVGMIQVRVLLFCFEMGDVDVDFGNNRLLMLMWALRDGKGCRLCVRRIMLLPQVRSVSPVFFSFKEGRADG